MTQEDFALLEEKEWEELSSFLRMKLGDTRQVFAWFIDRWGKDARYRADDESIRSKTSFFYLEGFRRNKVLLVAHADTVWDSRYVGYHGEHDIAIDQGIVRSTNKAAGLGADDRAGCSMLSLLRETGHSILVTEGEEQRIAQHIPLFPLDQGIFAEIHAKHQFMVQLDRKNSNDFKCYSVGSGLFKGYIHEQTDYEHIDDGGSTDIVALCDQPVQNRICGANFSIGYYNEHHPRPGYPNDHEYLNLAEWKRTLDTVTKLIESANLPRFPLPRQ
jgi:hypothetical protein